MNIIIVNYAHYAIDAIDGALYSKLLMICMCNYESRHIPSLQSKCHRREAKLSGRSEDRLKTNPNDLALSSLTIYKLVTAH